MKIDIKWGVDLPVDGPELLGLDVEGKQKDVRLVQIARGETAYLYDMSDPEQREMARGILADGRLEFVTHSRYDANTAWWSLGVDLRGRLRDSFLLACLVYPGGHHPHGLKPLSTRHIDGDLEAAEAELHRVFKETYGGNKDNYLERGYLELDVHHPAYELYSALDAVYCLRLYHELKKRQMVTGKVFFQQQKESDILGGSSIRGMMVDRERTEHLRAEAQANVDEANRRMRELLGVPAGSIKVGQWLEEQGVDLVERTDSGGPKLDKHVLKVLVPKYDEDTKVGQVLRARFLRAQSSNRKANLDNFLKFSEFDGFVHPDFKTAIAATGRMSITDPAMQTLSKEEGEDSLRGCFVARPGYVFIGADFDSQEMKLAAALSGDHELARRIATGADMHELAARAIVGEERWASMTPEQRKKTRNTLGKTGNFACLYGVGGFGFAKQTGQDVWAEAVCRNWDGTDLEVLGTFPTMDEAFEFANQHGYAWARAAGPAADAVKAWWGQYPELSAWNEENKRKTKNHEWPDGCITLDSGRKLPVEFAHATSNFKVQGTGRDITGTAIRLYDQKFPDTLALVIHDELLAEVPEDRVDEGLAALNEAMNFTFLSKVEDNPIPMDITATAEVLGQRWRKL